MKQTSQDKSALITFHAEGIVLVDFSFGGPALCIEVANLFGWAVLKAAASSGEVTFVLTDADIADRGKTSNRSPSGDIAGVGGVL